MNNITKNKLWYDPIIYSLETPKYHLLQFESINRFSGWVFNFGAKTIDSLNVYQDEQFLGHFQVNLPREEIAGYVPSISAAKTCGFAFDINVTAHSNKLIFEMVFDDASKELFCEFEVANAFEQQAYFSHLRKTIDSIPMPTGELVHLTQGHYNVDEYQNSIIPAVLNMRKYLEHSGVNLIQIHSVLDFGCGSGRLLVGWHLIAPLMELHGCDLNNNLLSWAQSHLPSQLNCLTNNLMPPLPYPNDQFDLIYLISVFTHLSFDTQKIWIQELTRILKVGGYILLTLHGEIYVRNTFWNDSQTIEAFLTKGFVETVFSPEQEGANNYGTYHAPEVVEKLFQGFQLVGYFPNGRINKQRILFQIAQSQDIYVFKYTN